MMELSLPDSKFKKSYIAAQRELRAEGAAKDIDFDRLKLRFEYYVQHKILQSRGVGLAKGHVPYTEYWITEGRHFLGRISLRHCLNESLERFGGHIGYEIRPSERKKGYGKKALALVLIEARKRGLREVLITCDDDNLGSIRIIEANRGKLIDKVQNPERATRTRRYRILLESSPLENA
jgi:predicted acetyltransferase